MRSLSVFSFISASLLACSQQADKKIDLASEKKSLLRTDEEFSRMSLEKGMGDAFVSYASEDVVKLREGKYPLIGRKQLRASFTSSPKNRSTLTWQIVRVDVADSADLGYTFGNWKYTTQTDAGKDTTMYGNYITVWKKQSDGSWKYVIDGGNSTPPPSSLRNSQP